MTNYSFLLLDILEKIINIDIRKISPFFLVFRRIYIVQNYS